MKKLAVALISGALLTSGIATSSANAATIKNGVACSKSGATTKVGSKSYKCAKNPYVTPTKRTWTLTGCLTAYALWKDSKQQYEDWKDLAKIAGPDGEKTLQELQTSITELENTMKNEVCKKGA